MQFHNFILGDSSELTKQVSYFYFRDGWAIADITYGLGVFWRQIDTSKYKCFFSDLKTCPDRPYDFRDLPYAANQFSASIFDGPWGGEQAHWRVPDCDGDGEDRFGAETLSGDHSPAKIMMLFRQGMREAHRILKDGGLLLMKCQDLVQGGVQVPIEDWVRSFGTDDLGMKNLAKYYMYHPGGKGNDDDVQQAPRNVLSALFVFQK
jgi:hypothetical protein